MVSGMVDEPRCHAHQSSPRVDNCSTLIILAFHYLSMPIHNEGLLRKLYLEEDLSSYQIAEISGWSKTNITQALRKLGIAKEQRRGPQPQFGMKVEASRHVPHQGEQRIIKKMVALRSKGLSFRAIANHLNEKKIPSKQGGQWNKTTVADIIRREQSQEK